MTPELQAVVERLEEVEKQIAHLASLAVTQSDADRTVEASRFIVRGEEGQPRAELSTRGEETALCLYHADGKLGVEISIRDQGPRLVFWDTNGKRRGTLETLAESGRTWLGLFDESGNVRACLGTSRGGEGPGTTKEGPWLEFYDAKQKSVVNVVAGEHGPRIGLFYGNRKRGIDLALSEHGPEIALFDTDGKPNVIVHASVEDGPEISLCDANGNNRVRLCLDASEPRRGPWLGLYDSQGRLRLDALVTDDYGPRLFLRDKNTNVGTFLREEGLWSAPPTSAADSTQPDSNVKGDSASMPKSWISRAFDRVIEWSFLSSVKFFIMFAFLAVPALALLVVVGSAETLAHDWFGIGTGPALNVDKYFFAGIVISLLLCIGLRAGAFDKVLANEK